MKKIVLMLLALLMFSAQALAYTTVVTLTITYIDNVPSGSANVIFDETSWGQVSATCSSDTHTGLQELNPGNAFSFACVVTTNETYRVTISGRVCKYWMCDTTWDLSWSFPFVAD